MFKHHHNLHLFTRIIPGCDISQTPAYESVAQVVSSFLPFNSLNRKICSSPQPSPVMTSTHNETSLTSAQVTPDKLRTERALLIRKEDGQIVEENQGTR